MATHIVLPRALEPSVSADAANGLRPRHAMAVLAERLGARLHAPGPEDAEGTPGDLLRARVADPPALWSLARRVLAGAMPTDTIFCASEAGGLQIMAVASRLARRPRIVVFVHNVDRPRARFAFRWWKAASTVDRFLACSSRQVEFLRQHLELPDHRARFVWDHTDTRFFTPGPKTPAARRKLIVSVGLEQRDYITLAKATAGLDVDVKISGFSRDAAGDRKTFPDPMPAHFEMRFYSWLELAQLVRDADAVVVSCRPNEYAAGVQSLMEAMACGAPLVVTRTKGLERYMEPDCMLEVPAGDAAAMRAAIERTLSDPVAAARRGAAARALAERRHDLDTYVSAIADELVAAI